MILHDRPRPAGFRRFRLTSHMSSTLLGADGTAELDAFARRIGLRPEWRQNSGTATEHYDLFDGAIDRAVAAGSVEVTGRELVERVVRPKRAALLDPCRECGGTGIAHHSNSPPDGVPCDHCGG